MEKKNTPLPKNEAARLAALKKYNVLDTLEEQEFNRLVELASIICQTPIALVSLIDEKRQWFKARVGLDVQETPREISFCQHTILGDDLFEVENAKNDDRFKDNPLVNEDPNIRFYAGYPLTDPEGYNVGTLCVINTVPQKLTEEQERALQLLSQEVVKQLVNRNDQQEKEKLHRYFELSLDLICIASFEGEIIEVNPVWKTILGYETESLKGKNFMKFVHPDDINLTTQAMTDLGLGKPVRNFINRYICANGDYKYLQWQSIADNDLIYAVAQDVTDRVLSEQELEKTASILREAGRITKMGAWELDLATNKTYWTDEVYAIHEVDTSFDHNKANGIEFYHKDYRQVITDAITKSITEVVSFDEKCKFISAKGNEKWVRSTGQPVVVDGKVEKLIGVFIDITEDVKKEEELQKTAAILKEAEKITKMGAWELDLATERTYWTDEVYAIHEVDKDFDHNKVNGIEFYHPDYQKTVSEAILKAIHENSSFDERCRFISAKGNEKWVRSTGHPIQKNGKVVKLYGVIIDITNQVLAEKQLEESKHLLELERFKLESIIEGTNVGTWIWNVQTNETQFDEIWAKIIGYTLDEISPVSLDTWNKYVHPDDLEESGRLLNLHFEGKQDYYQVEVRMKHKDGNWVWVLSRGKVITWTDDHQPLMMYGTHQDITESKELELELKANRDALLMSEEELKSGIEEQKALRENIEKSHDELTKQQVKLNAILNTIDDFIYSISLPDEKNVYLTPNCEQIYGVSSEDWMNNPDVWMERIYGEDKKVIPAIYRDIEVKGAYEYEYRIQMPDKSIKWVQNIGKVVEENNLPVRLDCVIRDVTERKLSQLKSEELAKRLDYALDASGDGIWDWRPQKKQTVYSKSWAEMLGYKVEDLSTSEKEWSDRLHPDEKEWIFQEINKVTKTPENGDLFVHEYRFKHKNGHYLWILNKGKIFERNYQGEAIRVVGTHTDITKDKEQQKQLEAAKLLAENANKSKSDFLSNMSHEIRTPLSGVVGFSKLLAKTELTQLQNLYVTNLQQSSKHLLAIVNDILDFSKIEAGKMELDIQEQDLQGFVSEIADILVFNANKNNTELLINVSPAISRYLLFDKVRLGQVLINLLSNAIKFTQNGVVELSVHEKERIGNQCRFTVEVRDTGIGISKDKLQTIFESFIQEDVSTTRKFGGTGLGLSIANKLLKLMGSSHLNVKSELGKGSIFSFEIELDVVKENSPFKAAEIKQLALIDNSKQANIVHQALAYFNVHVNFYNSVPDFLNSVNKGAIYEAVAVNADQLSDQEMIDLLMFRKEKLGDDSLKFILQTSRLESFDRLHDWEKEFDDKVCRYPMTVYKLEDCLFKGNEIKIMEEEKSVDISISVLIVDDNPINILLAEKVLLHSFPKLNVYTAKSGKEAIAIFEKQDIDLVLMDVHMPDMNGYETTVAMQKVKPETKASFVALSASDKNEERANCERYNMHGFLSKPIDEEELKAFIYELQ